MDTKKSIWSWVVTAAVGLFAGYCKFEAELKLAAHKNIELKSVPVSSISSPKQQNESSSENKEIDNRHVDSLRNTWKMTSNKDKVRSVVFASVYSVSAALITNFACKSWDNFTGVHLAAGFVL